MAGFIPFLLSETNYRMRVPLDDKVYMFAVRWNSRDSAHYVDIFQDDGDAVALGIKLVLGTNLAKRHLHPLFTRFVFGMMDSERSGVDAAFDDLGRRVFMYVIDVQEIARLGSTGATG